MEINFHLHSGGHVLLSVRGTKGCAVLLWTNQTYPHLDIQLCLVLYQPLQSQFGLLCAGFKYSFKISAVQEGRSGSHSAGLQLRKPGFNAVPWVYMCFSSADKTT